MKDIISTHKGLDNIDKKARHIIYKEENREALKNVLRYNEGSTILPAEIEKEVRLQLKDIRENNDSTQYRKFSLPNGNDVEMEKDQQKGWKFLYKGTTYYELETQGNTYSHTLLQSHLIYQSNKLDFKNDHVSYTQSKNDLIRGILHDHGEKITDDIPPFQKTDEYRLWEKEVEHQLIDQESLFNDDEKIYLKKIMDYPSNSRFKMFEWMGLLIDGIHMKDYPEKYNQVGSVIYEFIKYVLPKFLNSIKLDDGSQTNPLSLPSVQYFFLKHERAIEDMYTFLENSTETISNEQRRKENGYDIHDITKNIERMKNPRERILENIQKYQQRAIA